MNKISMSAVAVVLAFASNAALADTVSTTTNAAAGTTAQTNAGGVTAGASTTATGQGNTNGASASTTTSAGINGFLSDKSDFKDVMGTLSASTDAYDSIDWSKINLKHVKFVHVSKLNGYADAGLKLDDASKANMMKLDAKIAANAELTAALKQEGYTSSDVVAVSSDAQGDLVVFLAK